MRAAARGRSAEAHAVAAVHAPPQAPSSDPTYQKIVSNIEETVARKGAVIIITDKANKNLTRLSEHTVVVPAVADWLVPVVASVPLMLMGYMLGDARGCPIDDPRGLAKQFLQR